MSDKSLEELHRTLVQAATDGTPCALQDGIDVYMFLQSSTPRYVSLTMDMAMACRMMKARACLVEGLMDAAEFCLTSGVAHELPADDVDFFLTVEKGLYFLRGEYDSMSRMVTTQTISIEQVLGCLSKPYGQEQLPEWMRWYGGALLVDDSAETIQSMVDHLNEEVPELAAKELELSMAKTIDSKVGEAVPKNPVAAATRRSRM